MMTRLLAPALMLIAATQAAAADDKKGGEFGSTTIDVGMVVSDVEKAVKFYTEVIGFKEAKGFEVAGDYCKDVGLTKGTGLKVRVLVLGEGDAATKLKLMELHADKPKKNDNETISSELGFRYLTIFVADTNATLKRLQKAGVKPVAKGTQPLPKGFPQDVYLTIVRDPDGNLVELIGPKK